MNILIDDIRYHVDLLGEGFPLLLLHGFTGDASTWSPFCPKWGLHSRLIIPDIIGHGQTQGPNDFTRYHIEAAAKDLKRILDQMAIDQVDILGYSMGGRLALTFSILFPESVRKLILESASPGLLTEKERKARRMKDAELADFIMEQGIDTFVDYWEAIPLFTTMQQLPFAIREKVRNQRLNNSPLGLANSLLGMGTGAQPSWWTSLGQLSCTTLLLTGDKDDKFCAIAEKMLKELKSAEWKVIKDSGHAIHVEEPEKFDTIVSDFLLSN
jgi:2-succinyl-6-hydroxy-2,4-cyclohexadiene-1-carboxylate synthase